MFGSILACAFAAATQTVEAKMPTLATIRARFIVYLPFGRSRPPQRNAHVKIVFQAISFSLNRSHPPAPRLVASRRRLRLAAELELPVGLAGRMTVARAENRPPPTEYFVSGSIAVR